MYTVHASTLSFKSNRLRGQVPTWAPTLACTSDQFRSSWRTGPNHTPRMRTGPSLQRKDPGWGTLPFGAPNRKLLLLSKLILAPAIWSCLATAFVTAFISKRRDTKTVISSANADTFAERRPVKKIPCRPGFASSSLSLLQSNDIENRR